MRCCHCVIPNSHTPAAALSRPVSDSVLRNELTSYIERAAASRPEGQSAKTPCGGTVSTVFDCRSYWLFAERNIVYPPPPAIWGRVSNLGCRVERSEWGPKLQKRGRRLRLPSKKNARPASEGMRQRRSTPVGGTFYCEIEVVRSSHVQYIVATRGTTV